MKKMKKLMRMMLLIEKHPDLTKLPYRFRQNYQIEFAKQLLKPKKRPIPVPYEPDSDFRPPFKRRKRQSCAECLKNSKNTRSFRICQYCAEPVCKNHEFIICSSCFQIFHRNLDQYKNL